MRIVLSLVVSLADRVVGDGFGALPIGRGDLRWSRPPRLRARQHVLDQPMGLGQNGVVIAAKWPQNELRHADVDVLGEAREDRAGVAEYERVRGVASGAFGVGIHRPADTRRVPAAEMECEAGAVVIFVD